MLVSYVLAAFNFDPYTPPFVVVSQPVLLGTLNEIFHDTRGILYAIDEKTFFIQNFEYDGQGVSKLLSRLATFILIPTSFTCLSLIFHIVVYIYVYLNGQRVDASGGGTIINWSPT